MQESLMAFRLIIKVCLLHFKLSVVRWKKLIFSMLVNLPPSPTDLVLTKLAHEKYIKCCWYKMITQSCLTQTYLAIITTAYPICQQQEWVLLLWYGTIPWRERQQIKIDHIGILPTWQEQQFFLRKLDTCT